MHARNEVFYVWLSLKAVLTLWTGPRNEIDTPATSKCYEFRRSMQMRMLNGYEELMIALTMRRDVYCAFCVPTV